jgi:glycosidase
LSQDRDVRQGGKGILEESRLPMLWDGEQDDDLLAYYSELVQLRRAHRCLRRGSRKTVAVGSDIIAYQRQEGECCLLILINLSDELMTFGVPGNWTRVLFKTDQVCESRNLTEFTQVTLDGLSGMILSNLPA